MAHVALPQRSALPRHPGDCHSTALPSGNRSAACAAIALHGRGTHGLGPMSPYAPLRFTGTGKGNLVSDLPPVRPLRQCARWGIHTLARRSGGRRLYAAAVSPTPRQTEQPESRRNWWNRRNTLRSGAGSTVQGRRDTGGTAIQGHSGAGSTATQAARREPVRENPRWHARLRAAHTRACPFFAPAKTACAGDTPLP